MDKKKEAEKLFLTDMFHCSQAVLGVYPELIETDKALLMTSCFGGGMRHGEMCGAIVGALIAIGMVYGYNKAEDSLNKDNSNKITMKFVKDFKIEFGSYLCKDIKKDRPSCMKYINYAIDYIEKLKKENNNE